MEVELTDEAKELIGNLGYDPTYGARPLKRVIQKRLVDRLALKLLEGEFGPGDTVRVDAADGELVFGQAPRRRPSPPRPSCASRRPRTRSRCRARSSMIVTCPASAAPLGACRVTNVVSESKAAEVAVALASFVWFPLITEPGSELRTDSQPGSGCPPVS